MSISELEWNPGDDVDVEVPGLGALWSATVVRSGENLHLRLRDEPRHRSPMDGGTVIRLRRVVDEGLVAAETTLTQSYSGTGVHMMMRCPSSAEVVQRRDMFRMPTALPLTVQVKQAVREDWVSRRVYHHLTADASGSGCSIETELPLEPGDRLRVTLWPDRPHAVVAGARVVWTGPSDWPGLRRVGLAFTTISTAGQDRIVGTLLEEERVRRRVFADA